MKDKLVDMGLAFCCTVLPSAIILAVITYGVTIVDMVLNQATGITSFIGIVLVLPMGFVGVVFFGTGLGLIGIGCANIVPLKVNGEIIFFDKNPIKTSSSVGAGVFFIFLKLIVLIISVPVSLIIWLIVCIKILCGHSFDTSVYNPLESFGNKLFAILMAIAVVTSSLAWVPVAIHNAVVSPTKYDFEVTSIYFGQRTPYIQYCHVEYTVSNTEKADALLGDMVILSQKTNRQLVVSNVSFIPLELQGAKGTNEVDFYFSIELDDQEAYNLLDEDFGDLKVIFLIPKPIYPVWIWEHFQKESNEYSYNGKYKIIAK